MSAYEFPSPVAMAKYEMDAMMVMKAVTTWKSRFCYGAISIAQDCVILVGDTYNWDSE